MKRIVSSILVSVMLLSLSALFAVAENGVTVIDGGAYVSISVGKKYTSTGTRYANSAYSDTDAAGNMLGKLTDGSISTNGTANNGVVATGNFATPAIITVVMLSAVAVMFVFKRKRMF